jgi:hypothetical protein
MDNFKNFLAYVVTTAYAAWAVLPTTMQTALRNLFYAGLGFAMAFGWAIPANLAGVKVEALIFFQGLAQVLQAVIDKDVIPNLLTWLVDFLNLDYGLEDSGTKKHLVRK